MNELHVDSVTKEYDNRRILTDVHLNCRQGEIIALFGRNGSGKTTLMKIIYGSEPA
ncbi:ATP-binding cassette domain-containing protein, partial [Aegicerativicinus sediminis]